MNEQMRDDFEAWYFDGEIDKFKERTPYGYKYIAAQSAWLGWCAATLAERERAALVCDGVSSDFGSVAEGPFATDYGKHTHQSMAVGALNCAAAIRQGGA